MYVHVNHVKLHVYECIIVCTVVRSTTVVHMYECSTYVRTYSTYMTCTYMTYIYMYVHVYTRVLRTTSTCARTYMTYMYVRCT